MKTAIIAAVIVKVALAAWSVYLVVKVAEHVGAWPF
jgi:hypothetical protein